MIIAFLWAVTLSGWYELENSQKTLMTFAGRQKNFRAFQTLKFKLSWFDVCLFYDL